MKVNIKNIIGFCLAGVGLISLIVFSIIIFSLLPKAIMIGMGISIVLLIAGCVIVIPFLIEKIKGWKR